METAVKVNVFPQYLTALKQTFSEWQATITDTHELMVNAVAAECHEYMRLYSYL